MQGPPTPIVRDLVLVGGGHSHITVLKKFGMRPVAGVRLTLVSCDAYSPYSGMLPGLIAGLYTYDEAHIDLRKLATFAGARFLQAEVVGLDPERQLLKFADRPALPYDLLSLNTGSTPGMNGVAGAGQSAVPVKPIAEFLPRWEALANRVADLEDPARIAVVGAGAGGVELTLAMLHRLGELLAEANRGDRPEMHIFSGSSDILPTHNAFVRRKFRRILAERDVTVHTDAMVTDVTDGQVRTRDGWTGQFHEVVWVTDASGPDWTREAGLAVDERGFVRVDECLRSLSHPKIFAAGDVASVDAHPRAKAGVFAVRQGPPLEVNLRRALLGREPKPFQPQKQFLSLVSTGDKYAVASRSRWSVEGAWVWRWKDWIDRRFMERFQLLEPMAPTAGGEAPTAAASVESEGTTHEIRCRGCASKVGSTALLGALRSIEPFWRDDVPGGLATKDDAAILEIPPNAALVQSVDFFPAIVDDPYLFGKIAANHALNDIFAMGATPQSALAVAGIPFGSPRKTEDLLRQLLLGANEILCASQTALAGGHTSECPELALGFVINGVAAKDEALRKGGLRPGDALVLTKALGTGALFAAEMRLKAQGRWIDGAIASMLQPANEAASILRSHGARGCTDVTGFGLAGHLAEMLEASDVSAVIELDSMPALDGTLQCFEAGIASSLDPENRRVWPRIAGDANGAGHAMFPLLFDPQTAGGLLAGVESRKADACVDALREAGYRQACRIGTVLVPDGGARVSLA